MIKVRILITLKDGILDAQGKTILKSLNNLGYNEVKNVRTGKVIDMKIDIDDRDKVEELVEKMAKKLLVNPVMEDYTVEVEKL